MFRDTPAIRALVNYLATGEAQTIWAKLGGYSAPAKTVDASRVPGRHHPHDRNGDRQGQDVPVRPLRPPAGVVRRHGRPGRVQDLPGLPEEPEERRRHRRGSRVRGSQGVRVREVSERKRRRNRSGAAHGGGSTCATSELLPAERGRDRASSRPPLILLFVWIVYPTIYTIIRSFSGKQAHEGFLPYGDFVGFDNYKALFTTDILRDGDQEQRDLDPRRARHRHGYRSRLRGADRAHPLGRRVQDDRLHADGDLALRDRRDLARDVHQGSAARARSTRASAP